MALARSKSMAMPKQKTLLSVLDETRLRILELHFRELKHHDIKVTFAEFTSMIEATIGFAFDQKELEFAFNKIDLLCEGYINWDSFISHVASEMQMREQILATNEGALKANFRIIKPGHQELICSIEIMPHVSPDASTIDYLAGRYITASKDGCIRVWTQTWQLMKSKQCIAEWSQRKRSTSMIQMTCLPNAFVVAVSTANETINFYDYTSTKLDLLCSLCEIGAIVTCMNYWFDPARPHEGILIFGDSSGNITLLRFSDILENKLFGLPQTKRNMQKVLFSEILGKKNKYATALHFTSMHEEWVKSVLYIHRLKSILSCSNSSNYSMILQSTVYDMSRRIYSVNKGINCFDYDGKLGIIVTGGIDRTIRVWNPFINRRCLASFFGHPTPIIHIIIIADAEQLLSLAADKSLKIWDLRDESCIQSIFGQIIPTGPYPITALFHNKIKRQIVLTTTHVITTDRLWDAIGGHDSMNFLTHPKPLVGVLFSETYKQVITACEQGVIMFWRLDTGQKVVQITNAHSINLDGVITGVEITAMALDEEKKSLITAGHDYLIKMWSLSSGALVRTLAIANLQEVDAIVPAKSSIYFAGWNRRIFKTNPNLDNDSIKYWPIRHEDDIVDMAFMEPNMLVTCSWDGKTKLWLTDLGRVKKTFSLFDYFNEKSLTFRLSGTTVYRSYKSSVTGTSIGMKSKKKSISRVRSPSFVSDTSSMRSSKQKGKIIKPIERKSALHQIRDNPPAFTRMLVLNKRKQHAQTGNLFLANMNGIVEFWSTHLSGGPLAVFAGVTSPNHFITCMTTDLKTNNLVFTGDSNGYIRVWYIRYYHNAAETFSTVNPNAPNEETAQFPFMKPQCVPLANKIKNNFAKFKPTEFSGWLDIENPPLLTSFRAHLTTIKQITYISEYGLLLSASSDQSVRLWTQYGRYIATFGDNRGWNLNNLLTKTVKPCDRKVPFDIRQVGSAVTLQIELAGIGLRWTKVRYLFLYLYVKNVSRKKRRKSKLDVMDSAKTTQKGESIETLRRLRKEQELLQLGSPIGNYFAFKKQEKNPATLPTVSKAKREMKAVYAYMINYEVEPINLEAVLGSAISHDTSSRLKQMKNVRFE